MFDKQSPTSSLNKHQHVFHLEDFEERKSSQGSTKKMAFNKISPIPSIQKDMLEYEPNQFDFERLTMENPSY